jgi:hypothetical protein
MLKSLNPNANAHPTCMRPGGSSLALATALLLLLPSCWFVGGVNGSGNRVEETRSVNVYHSIHAGGRFDLRLIQGPAAPLRLEGEDNILPLIESEVRNGVLHLDTEERLGRVQPIVVHAHAPEWRSIELSGAGSMQSETPLTGGSLRMRISGAGDIDAQVDVQELELEVSGAGECRLSGAARNVQFRASGAGDLDALRLRSENSTIRISGAGNAKVYVTGRLDATISGAGSVRYAGQPESVQQDVSGAGSIKALEAQ